MVALNIKTATMPRKATPDRPVEERLADFGPTAQTPDIKDLFTMQAARCCNCAEKGCNRGDVSPAQQDAATGCPLNTYIPGWLTKVAGPKVTKALDKVLSDSDSEKLTEQGLSTAIAALLQDPEAAREVKQAFLLAMDRNPLSEILGAVCPQAEGLCEGGSVKTRASCVAGAAGYKPITIGNIENLIGRIGREAGWVAEMLNAPLSKPQEISVIGAGPAGMAAAMEARRNGYKVTLYSREEHIGGLLVYGLPGTKLSKDVVAGYENIFAMNSGIVLRTETNVDAAMMKSIEAGSDAVILAIGAQAQKDIGLEGQQRKGYVDSIRFLDASNRAHHLGEKPYEGADGAELYAKGKHVVVIGGGDTSADCVREAIRQGAESVKLVYRGDEEKMRASEKEITRAKVEGIGFVFNESPLRIEGGEQVREIVFLRPEVTAESTRRADMVVNATGFTGETNLAEKLGIPGLQQYQGSMGIMVVNPDRDFRVMMSDAEGAIRPSSKFYAVGDDVQINSGRCLAVWAVRDARNTVRQLDRQFKANEL
jgi:glutamate synthase (NADPH/NADH) small chain